MKDRSQNYYGRNHGCGQDNWGKGSFNSSNNQETSQISYSLRRWERWHNSRQNERERYDKSLIQCYNCNKYDHYVYECRSSTNNMKGQANYVKKKYQYEHTILLAYKGESKEKNT